MAELEARFKPVFFITRRAGHPFLNLLEQETPSFTEHLLGRGLPEALGIMLPSAKCPAPGVNSRLQV